MVDINGRYIELGQGVKINLHKTLSGATSWCNFWIIPLDLSDF